MFVMVLTNHMTRYARDVRDWYGSTWAMFTYLLQLPLPVEFTMEKLLIGMGLKVKKEIKKGIWQPTNDSDLKVFSRRALTALPKWNEKPQPLTKSQRGHFFKGRRQRRNVKNVPLTTFSGVVNDCTRLD